jgi:transposase InsO family protein
MKDRYPWLSMQGICEQYGRSRQGYYQCQRRLSSIEKEEAEILHHTRAFKRLLPKSGVRKLRFHLQEKGLRIGRDRLFEVLRAHGLLVRRRRKYARGTDSKHWLKVYPDLVKGLVIGQAERLLVSDITYVHTMEGFSYLHLVSDAYSKKIMGGYLSRDLSAQASQKALGLALNNRIYNHQCTHHSDRGIQYCSQAYIKQLEEHQIQVSMTQSGSPYDNAIAERIIGILKEEFNLDHEFSSHAQAQKAVAQALYLYNHKRPHLSCGYLTPEKAHEQGQGLENKWKPKKLSTHLQKQEKNKRKKNTNNNYNYANKINEG